MGHHGHARGGQLVDRARRERVARRDRDDVRGPVDGALARGLPGHICLEEVPERSEPQPQPAGTSSEEQRAEIRTACRAHQLCDAVHVVGQADKVIEVGQGATLRPIEQLRLHALQPGQRGAGFLSLHLQSAGHQVSRIFGDDADAHISGDPLENAVVTNRQNFPETGWVHFRRQA